MTTTEPSPGLVDRLKELAPGEESFDSRLRSASVAARVGVWLGVCFAITFVTGLISHYAQNPDHPVTFPTSPYWGYRLNQGLHVGFGMASIPLLLIKLWTVYPKLFQSMPRHLGALLVTALERLSIASLVAASLFEVFIGAMNVAQWYIWKFDFRAVHYAMAFVVIGSLLVHIAVKLPITREVLGADAGVEHTGRDRDGATEPGAVGRRGLLRTAWLSAGVSVLAGSSIAGTLPLLNHTAILAARSRKATTPGNPFGIPINHTAKEVDVTAAAMSASFRCKVVVAGIATEFTRDDLLAMAQTTHVLPISCVEGWSASGEWSGVPLRTLLDAVGAPRGRDVTFTSLQKSPSAESSSLLQANFADDERTLLALHLNGQPLSLDHGYPVRLIAPDRPGVFQTKWVGRIEVAL